MDDYEVRGLPISVRSLLKHYGTSHFGVEKILFSQVRLRHVHLLQRLVDWLRETENNGLDTEASKASF